MSSVKHAIIAAAGVGSRLGLGKTKCLLEINRRPLIAYLLKLLDDVEDVRIVIGFQEQEVIETVLRYRRDVTFVRNPEYLSTSTLTSYWLGCQGIEENCLFMDADIIFDPDDFIRFKEFCAGSHQDNILGITRAKTHDAVYVSLYDNRVNHFSREENTPFEWANLCFIDPRLLAPFGDSVFQQLEQYLPLTAREIISFEIDTKGDMELAMQSSIIKDELYFSTI
ncbi:NTP transferase domain-containing protein [Enterobacter pasteurii]|uniref:NTP transferase domain-containing protein n=1 Tax=Enterobacter pasteurii TaxID=3029761 RepID=UPI0011DE035E|nr:NTP transferase domain-containing protein [Enterobacter pasteurii]QLA68417.1 NTP transferase domain-containing protein [Enterobacter pasteurii]